MFFYTTINYYVPIPAVRVMKTGRPKADRSSYSSASVHRSPQ
jgi:hypothetical protein